MEIHEAFFDLLMCESIQFSASDVLSLRYERPGFFPHSLSVYLYTYFKLRMWSDGMKRSVIL
jgi:hypothetical protein